MSLFSRAFCALPLAAALFATPASAAYVAHFTTTDTIVWTQSADQTGGTIAGSGFGELTMRDRGGGHSISDDLRFIVIPVAFTLSGAAPSGNPIPTCCGSLAQVQRGVILDFTLTYSGLSDLVVDGNHYGAGTTLLSGDDVWSALGRIAFIQTNHSGSFSSPFADFSGRNAKEVAIQFGSTTPVFGAEPGESVGDFTSNVTRMLFVSSVPEPATWAFMITGFGFVGAALRQRRKTPQAHAI